MVVAVPAERYLPPIVVKHLTWTEFESVVASPVLRRDLADAGGSAIVVSGVTGGLEDRLASLARSIPAVVVLDADLVALGPAAAVADVVASGDDLAAVIAGVEANPVSAVAAALLLRGSEERTIADGLAAESAVYSTLQSGPEFARWRADRPTRAPRPPTGPVVRAERRGAQLTITLQRPEARNALDARLRDELWEALLVAAADPSVNVTLRGEGPDFCSGGDLDEFGSRADPATGHLVRLARSLGGLMAEIADRVTVELHGSCFGSGIELPAFAGRVRAQPDTVIALPELSLGLVPGAGGTVSLPRRIGRHRTALLTLSGRPVDAATALSWGLVDELTDSAPVPRPD